MKTLVCTYKSLKKLGYVHGAFSSNLGQMFIMYEGKGTHDP